MLQQEDRSNTDASSPQIPGIRMGSGLSSIASKIKNSRSSIKKFLALLGPGLITGASDDDPSGIGTYAQAGAAFGYSVLWTALITFPMMLSVQYMCAKIGMVSGKGLARVLRDHYSKALVYPVVTGLAIANTINAGVDIGAIGAAINLIVPVPIYVLIIPTTLIILTLQIWGSYRLIAKTFKWLALALLAYIASALFSHPGALSVLKGTFIPTFHLDSDFLTILVGLLGTTITPYLFFWQSNQEVEEEISMGRTTLRERQGATKQELRYARWDTAIGMFFSNMVMYFIIMATAATLHATGKINIQSATEAAQALRPVAGNAAYVLFAVGLIGAGVLCVPILTGSAAYAIAEVLGWKHGLDEKPRRAKLFYITIAISTLVGMLINFIGINPITALVWTAVINGFLAPPILVIIMLVANNKEILGNSVNNRPTNVLGWATTFAMFAAAIALVVTWGKS